VPNPAYSPWVVFTLTGELDLSRTPELDEMFASWLHDEPANAIVDLSAVTFMDSTVISWLLRLRDRADQVGGLLRLVAPEGGILVRLLSLTGLDDRFAIFPTTLEAGESHPT
jgi:anti-sigma B factor antagonist